MWSFRPGPDPAEELTVQSRPSQIMQEARDLIALNDGVIMSQPTRHRCTHPRGTEGVRDNHSRVSYVFCRRGEGHHRVKKLFCERLSDQKGSAMRRGD